MTPEAKNIAQLERVAIGEAFIAGWLDAIARQPWDDMHDWLALTAREYVAARVAPSPQAPTREELERALREIAIPCLKTFALLRLSKSQTYLAEKALERISALTSKEQNNG